MFKNRKRLLILLLLLLFISFFILSYQKKNYSLLNEILAYPLNVFNLTTSYIYTTFDTLKNAVRENEKLRKQLNELMLDRQLYSEIMLENKRLKNILNLKENNPSFFTAAKPIARGYDRLLNTIIIDKGKEDGIKKDMAVITVNGLVGKVHQVKNNFSEVILLKDPNFSAAVRLQNSRHEGIVSGTGLSYCLLKYIPPEQIVQEGEILITSGLDGVFPPGILVGIVSHIGTKRLDFFQYIEVMPFQPDSKIEEVIILKPYSKSGS